MRDLPAAARCARHQETAAVAVCDRCGAFSCVKCHHPTAQNTDLCEGCYRAFVTTGASAQANLALVLALLGFVAVVPGIAAFFVARAELRRIERGEAPYAGQSISQLARSLGVFFMLLAVVIIGLLALRLF